MLTRRFHVVRDVDVTGVSGTGTVAVFPNVEAVEALHGHNGATHLDWED